MVCNLFFEKYLPIKKCGVSIPDLNKVINPVIPVTVELHNFIEKETIKKLLHAKNIHEETNTPISVLLSH